MLVRDCLENSADRLPDKTALICDGERFTYRALDAQANRLAQCLLANGVQRGDRVVIHLPNNAAAVVAIFAVLKAGAVFVPVNPTAKAAKLGYILNNCRATALISELRDGAAPSTEWLKVMVDCAGGASSATATVLRPGTAALREGEAPVALSFEAIQEQSAPERPA